MGLGIRMESRRGLRSHPLKMFDLMRISKRGRYLGHKVKMSPSDLCKGQIMPEQVPAYILYSRTLSWFILILSLQPGLLQETPPTP